MRLRHPQSFAKPIEHGELGYETPYAGGMLSSRYIIVRAKNFFGFPQNDVDCRRIGERVELIQTLCEFLS